MKPASAPPLIRATYSLVGHHGAPVTERSHHGLWQLVQFGFTSCRVVCPRALAKLTLALDAVESAPLVAHYVTVDPERDSPEVMRTFLRESYPRFTGMTGTTDQVEDAKEAFKVFARRRPEPHGYAVPHTAITYPLDPEGRPVHHWPDTHDVMKIAADLVRLLGGDSGTAEMLDRRGVAQHDGRGPLTGRRPRRTVGKRGSASLIVWFVVLWYAIGRLASSRTRQLLTISRTPTWRLSSGMPGGIVMYVEPVGGARSRPHDIARMDRGRNLEDQAPCPPVAGPAPWPLSVTAADEPVGLAPDSDVAVVEAAHVIRGLWDVLANGFGHSGHHYRLSGAERGTAADEVSSVVIGDDWEAVDLALTSGPRKCASEWAMGTPSPETALRDGVKNVRIRSEL